MRRSDERTGSLFSYVDLEARVRRDQPRVKRLISSDHFSVDGTLLEAWASTKSKEKRSNETHQSTTDPEARLYRKGDGQPAKLCYLSHALMENRNGLAVDGGVTLATGTAEREAALTMLDRRPRRRRITLGADKAYDVTDFIGAPGAAQRR